MRIVGVLIGSSLVVPPHIYPHQLKMATGTLCFPLGKAVWSYHDVAPSDSWEEDVDNCDQLPCVLGLNMKVDAKTLLPTRRAQTV